MLIENRLPLESVRLTWYAVRRTYDITNNIPTSLYVAALMVEDFLPSISTTVRLSSVPL